jgi:CDP-paratose synthetase
MEKISQSKLNAIWGGYPYRPYDTMYAVAPIAKNIELLNWQAKISLEEGIRIYLNEIHG